MWVISSDWLTFSCLTYFFMLKMKKNKSITNCRGNGFIDSCSLSNYNSSFRKKSSFDHCYQQKENRTLYWYHPICKSNVKLTKVYAWGVLKFTFRVYFFLNPQYATAMQLLRESLSNKLNRQFRKTLWLVQLGGFWSKFTPSQSIRSIHNKAQKFMICNSIIRKKTWTSINQPYP